MSATGEKIELPELPGQEAKKPILIRQFNLPMANAEGHEITARKIAAIEAEGYENYQIINMGLGEIGCFFRLKGADNA
ncbi:MAG: hypothetical protein GX556_05875 [Fibrobacter sp.]|nr:hypothetical protein [Fibrobacter sp.]